MAKQLIASLLCCLTFCCFTLSAQAAPVDMKLPGLEIQQSAVVQLGNGIGEAVVFKARNDSSSMKPWVQGIACFDAATGGWKILHQSRHYFDATVECLVAELLPGNVQQVLLIQRAGSGGFLSYDVLGAVDGKLQTLLSRSRIFLGHVRVQDGALIEENGDLATAWRWRGDQFVSSPHTEPQPILREGDWIVRYGIDESGRAWVDWENVALKLGSRLYLRREGDGAVARVLYGGNQVIENEGEFYLAKKPGVTDIIIIPNGYNHDKAKKIDVEVKE